MKLIPWDVVRVVQEVVKPQYPDVKITEDVVLEPVIK